MIVVVVFALLTVCAVAGLETLPVKLASPAYVAVRDLAPGIVKAIEQVPAAAVAVQLCVPSETVTLPVGVPLPGAATATVKLIGTAWPVTDGSGRSDVIVVVVAALLTVWAVAGVEILPLKFASPAYVAVRFLAPGVAKAIEQLPVPEVRLPVQLCVPSETVTLPVGVPVPGGFTATVKLMAPAGQPRMDQAGRM